ncbi:Stk1 family PASTA domain-containing Ser/Thr kinase [Egicoccus sp. AB-alg6-2]|uniref:Stk1 family PASTA domain-containing Ser/Thr kinase n=1 Tax=Egicoccus sp. AB-alg6-2 TaxID=3242692 RepID=UPI00359CFFF3
MSQGRVLVDRYELRRPLGRGGMAEVWAAHDRTLDREVAIKLLLDRFRDDEAFTNRFHDEARHVARLNHPNLVAVYDTGAEVPPDVDPASGILQPFIVMELVEGRSLQQAIDAGGLTEDRSLEVVADVCAALQYAHSRGLVHRDVKPGNILLADDGTVKVTDFGIARAVGNENVTRTAAVLGTAAYLAPEQAQGLEVDERSDLYSLGVVLYEALTGRQPFRGDSAVTVAYQHVQEPPRPPRELEPSVSPAAEAITMRALAKNPANRYQDAGAMREDLLNARVGNPVAAPAVLTPNETALLAPTAVARPLPSHEQERRKKGALYGVLAVLVILALIGGAYALAGMFDDDTRRVAVPDVVDQTLEAAEEILTRQGFVRGEVTEEVSDGEAGRVLRQSPSADTMAPEGSEVDLVVSVSEELVTVPDVEGRTEEEAFRAWREAGLAVGSGTPQPSDDVEAGRIISTDPEAGAEVPLGSRIDYVVSTGREEVVVRPVTQYSESEAQFRLEEQGFEVNILREFDDVVSEGFVIRQDPPAGTRRPRGDIITIVVSRGPEEIEPEPTEEPEPEPTEEPEPTPTEPSPSPTEPSPSPTEPEPSPTEDPPEDGD